MPRARKSQPIVAPFGQAEHTQPAHTPTGLPYGEHQKLVDSQAAIPLPGGGAPNPSAPAPAGAPAAGAPGPAPMGALAAMEALVPPTPLSAPSMRPDEPLTAGLAGSPMAPASTGPDPRAKLEALYQVAPSADLADLIEHLDG